MFEQLMRSQSFRSDGVGGAPGGEGLASAGSGQLALGGGGSGQGGALLPRPPSVSDARSSFDSRQNSMSRGGGSAKAAAAAFAEQRWVQLGCKPCFSPARMIAASLQACCFQLHILPHPTHTYTACPPPPYLHIYSATSLHRCHLLLG
jgi:hypothetical protein